MIKLSDISKHYLFGDQKVTVLDRINLDIAAGDCVALLGRSGCGKTTTMNLIGLLDKPDTGTYYLSGQNMANKTANESAALRNNTFGFIFQNFFLLPRLSVYENVALPLHYQGKDKSFIQDAVAHILAEVDMLKYMRYLPNCLSGGQQQRVAIARALVGQPKIILADEPTGSLDGKTGDQIMKLLLGLQKQYQTTVLIVTHDPHIAKRCQRQIKMIDGKIVEASS